MNRCALCRKKLRIGCVIECKCGDIFCPKHAIKTMHNCTYDYKKEERKKLEKTLPLIQQNKLEYI